MCMTLLFTCFLREYVIMYFMYPYILKLFTYSYMVFGFLHINNLASDSQTCFVIEDSVLMKEKRNKCSSNICVLS